MSCCSGKVISFQGEVMKQRYHEDDYFYKKTPALSWRLSFGGKHNTDLLLCMDTGDSFHKRSLYRKHHHIWWRISLWELTSSLKSMCSSWIRFENHFYRSCNLLSKMPTLIHAPITTRIFGHYRVFLWAICSPLNLSMTWIWNCTTEPFTNTIHVHRSLP